MFYTEIQRAIAESFEIVQDRADRISLLARS